MASVSSATAASAQTSSSINRSGLTVDDVVTAKVQPILNQIDSINSTISTNQTKVAAYQDMQKVLVNLQNAADALRAPLSSSTDVFNERAATLTSSSSVSASQLLSADVAAGTATGSHKITVSQLATVERIGSANQTSRTSSLNLTGDFTIGENGKTAASISVTADMSLNDIANAINKQSGSTGVSATVITVSSSSSNPQYMLVLTGADTNQPIQMSTTSGTVLSDLGLTTSDGSTAASVLQNAQPAVLTVDGVSGIQRDTNDISDIIDGVTLHLTQADPNTSITMQVNNDTTSIQNAIQLFVDSYNAWRSFVSQNQATQSDGTASSSATLFGDGTLRSIATQIDSALTSYIGNISLGAIGITLDSDNNLQIDSTKLTTALTNNFNQVKQLFEFTASTSSNDLTLSNHGSSTYVGTFTVNVTTDNNGNVTGATATDAKGNTVPLTYSGNVISGTSGSTFDGLQFIFTGSSSESITVSTSQGIADKIYQLSGAASNTTYGSVQTIVNSLNDQDTTLQAKASDLQVRANTYQTYLLNKYGRLESSISQANQLQTIITQLMSYDTAK